MASLLGHFIKLKLFNRKYNISKDWLIKKDRNFVYFHQGRVPEKVGREV